MQNRRGLAFIEFLILVVFIGFTAAIAIPRLEASAHRHISARCSVLFGMIHTTWDSTSMYEQNPECVPRKPTIVFKGTHYEMVPDTTHE